MRNLKKTLCLLLALVFVLGLCTVGAADIVFTDEQSIQYKEAVQTMAGLGILKGYEDGSFKPAQSLTRAEAAKIIAYVAGGEGVDNGATEQIFDDVPTSHWANKYISYCYRKNIINGVGANKFDPTGQVTRIAVMKMLLAACGYGAQGEFTGAEWETEVFRIANETKILQGFKASDWSGAATREEMAHLSYNTLMTVVQVAYSKNTEAYEPKYVNGIYNVTLAEQPWGIRTDEGVIVANKATGTNKGTVLERIEDGTAVLQKYYVTEMDEDPAMLGHQVRITYRLETSGGSQVAKAFFLEDLCTEVKAKDVLTLSTAKSQFTFNNGGLVSYNVPSKEVWSTLPGTFVLNADGLVVAYKAEGYFVAALRVDYRTLQATVLDPTTNTYVPVQAPAGAVNGSLVTVYHMGDVYTAKLCPSQTGVLINQISKDSEGNATYNYGSVYPSKAENLINSPLPLGITRLGGTLPQMELGSRYTLYFDDQGGCIGFSDKAGASTVINPAEYGLLLSVYTRQTSEIFMTTGYYAQIIRGDGTVVDNLPIDQTTYASGLTPNTVCKLTNYSGTYRLTPASSAEVGTGYYTASDPFTDYTGAYRICYNGQAGGEPVQRSDVSLNKYTPKANAPVIYLYSSESLGYNNYVVRRVKTVWFTETGSSGSPSVNTADVIFIASTDWYEATAKGYSYLGYKNGEIVKELILSTPPTATGFATCKKGTDGVYTVKGYMVAGDGTATGVRTEAINVQNGRALMLNESVLNLYDKNNVNHPLSLSNVKVVMVGDAAAAAPSLGISIENVSDLFAYARTGNLKITVTLLESVDSLGNHTIDGNTIYVTGIAY
jgi:S-layer homology domain.